MTKTDKQRVSESVLELIQEDMVLGIGTGSTVECLIELLPTIQLPSKIVSSSERTTKALQSVGIDVVSLNEVGHIDLYLDGADQVNIQKVAIKGGGMAHTQEKILAVNATVFVGMITEDKYQKALNIPLPIEVLPVARSFVAKQLLAFGEPRLREGKTEHGNEILDLYHVDYKDTDMLETTIKTMVGVIESGLFSKRRFDKVYIAKPQTIEIV